MSKGGITFCGTPVYPFDSPIAPKTPTVLPVERGVSVKYFQAISMEGVANPITIATHLDQTTHIKKGLGRGGALMVRDSIPMPKRRE